MDVSLHELQTKIAERDFYGVKSLNPDSMKKIPNDLFVLLYQSNAMAGEAGEAANIVKKIIRDQLLTPDEIAANNLKAIELGYRDCEQRRLAELGKELSDVISYCALIAEAAGIHLPQVTADKFNEVSDKMKLDIHLS